MQLKPLRALATASASHAKTHMICNVPASEHCRASEIICLLQDANHRYPTARPSGPATSFSGHLLYASVQHEIFALLRTCRQTGSSYFPFYFYGLIACAFRGGPGCSDRISASISGSPAGFKPPSGAAASRSKLDRASCRQGSNGGGVDCRNRGSGRCKLAPPSRCHRPADRPPHI